MEKKYIIPIIALFAIAIFVSVYKPNVFNKSKDMVSNSSQESYDKSDTDAEEKTPEQVLQELEALENPEPEGPLSAEIVSPKEETFVKGQARYYKAEITNGLSNMYKKTVCNWKYYINEKNEEVLYKEQTVPMTADHCGFTTTFINKGGKLRVSLEVIMSDKKTDEVLDTYTTEKEYIVL